MSDDIRENALALFLLACVIFSIGFGLALKLNADRTQELCGTKGFFTAGDKIYTCKELQL